MNSQQLLFINIVLGVIFLIYFLFGRGANKAPTRLNLKNKETPFQPEAFSPQISQKNQHSEIGSKMTILEPETVPSNQKNLAIFFIYNGHDWEAHSVLGVAQGANMKTVTEAYQKLLSSSDPQSYDFLEAAYKAIHKLKRRDLL